MASPTRSDTSPTTEASASSPTTHHSPKEQAAAVGLSKLNQHGPPTKSKFNRTPVAASKPKPSVVKHVATTAVMHSKQTDIEGISHPDSTDSEDGDGSDWGAERDHESECDSAASHASNKNGSVARGKGKGKQLVVVQKSLKRVRGNSASGAATPAKRVRSTPLSRSAPRATSASLDLIPDKFT